MIIYLFVLAAVLGAAFLQPSWLVRGSVMAIALFWLIELIAYH